MLLCKKLHTKAKTGRQRDGHTDRQAGRQRETNRETDSQADTLVVIPFPPYNGGAAFRSAPRGFARVRTLPQFGVASRGFARNWHTILLVKFEFLHVPSQTRGCFLEEYRAVSCVVA